MSDITRRNLVGGIGAAAAAAAFVGTTSASAQESAGAAPPGGWQPVDKVTIGGVQFSDGESVTVLFDDGARRLGTVSETSEITHGDITTCLVELRFDGGAPGQDRARLQGPDGLSDHVLLVPNGPTVASATQQKGA